jgi:hypothetical protein
MVKTIIGAHFRLNGEEEADGQLNNVANMQTYWLSAYRTLMSSVTTGLSFYYYPRMIESMPLPAKIIGLGIVIIGTRATSTRFVETYNAHKNYRIDHPKPEPLPKFPSLFDIVIPTISNVVVLHDNPNGKKAVTTSMQSEIVPDKPKFFFITNSYWLTMYRAAGETVVGLAVIAAMHNGHVPTLNKQLATAAATVLIIVNGMNQLKEAQMTHTTYRNDNPNAPLPKLNVDIHTILGAVGTTVFDSENFK